MTVPAKSGLDRKEAINSRKACNGR